MNIKYMMHVAFYTDQLEVLKEFYEQKLDCKAKMIVRYKAYKGKNNPFFSPKAETNPDDICILYLEIAPGQFLEIYPRMDGQEEHDEWNQRLGYSHFALIVDDIHATREELAARGVEIDTEPKIGNSHTWQMWIHDPDGNKIEIMQYTPESYQVVGHLE